MASKSKKTSKGGGGSTSKAAPVRKKQPASAPSGVASRAKRAGKPSDKAKAKAKDGVKKRPARAAKASFATRSTGRVQALATAAGKSQAEPDSKRRRQTADSLEAAKAAIDAALDKKALLPVLIDVSALASYTDFIGIVSGRSDRQVDAIADGILASMKARGRSLLGQEGSGSGRWTLLDFGDVVVHVFYHPVREFYDLESLWVDAPRIQLRIPPEAVMAQPDALYGNL